MTGGEIRLSKGEIEKLLFPYRKEHIYLTEAVVGYNPPKGLSIHAKCALPTHRPSYLNKEISYATATEGLALITRCFILMYVVALSEKLLPDLRSSNMEICRDPEVLTLRFQLKCHKKIERNIGSKPREIAVKACLSEDWSVAPRRDRPAFSGSVKFELEDGSWDGEVDTFIWLE